MANPTTNIETLTRRTLTAYLRDALPEAVTVVRSLIPAPPESARVTVLPGAGTATTEAVFLGNAQRVSRDDDFDTRVWVEVIGDDQAEVEDLLDGYVGDVENVVANNATLGNLAGIIAFGTTITRTTHPLLEITAGVFYAWVELSISADCRYD